MRRLGTDLIDYLTRISRFNTRPERGKAAMVADGRNAPKPGL